MIADAHCDLLLELEYREHRLRETGRLRRTWLPLLSAGGVGLQVCPIVVELELQPEGTLRQALGQVASFQRAVRENDDRVVGVPTRADLEPVERGERLGLVMALEGVEPFGYDVWPADLFWELGLRVVSLTWNRRNRTPTVRPRAAASLGSAVRCSDGDERVCLAGDWTKRLAELAPSASAPDGLAPPGLEPGSALAGLAGPEDHPALVEALEARGWKDERLDGLLSSNLLRLLREALPRSL